MITVKHSSGLVHFKSRRLGHFAKLYQRIKKRVGNLAPYGAYGSERVKQPFSRMKLCLNLMILWIRSTMKFFPELYL